MNRSNVFSFYSGSYHPTNKKLRSRRTNKLCQTQQALDTSAAKAKGKHQNHIYQIQFGHAVPKKWKDVICLDTLNGNHNWRNAVAKEIAALVELGCFDVKSPNFKPSSDYQYVCMHWVYAVKSN